MQDVEIKVLTATGNITYTINTAENMVLTSWIISPPKLREHYIQVPFRDGALDLTESLIGSPTFDMQEAKLEFECLKNYKDSRKYCDELIEKLHGRRAKVNIIGERTFSGRVTLDVKNTKSAWKITIKVKIDV